MLTPWLDLRTLDLLVAVAETGSLGAGARRVGMAQPNASRLVARLERETGLGLLVRSPTGTELTEHGGLVVDWARTVLDAAHELSAGVEALRSTPAAPLTVAASLTIAEHLAPVWLARLRRRAPEVTVGMRVTNSSEVLEAVRSGHVAIGFVEGPGVPAGLHTTIVGLDELVVVVAPDHPWAERTTPLAAADLAAAALVTREPGSGTRDALDQALAAAGHLGGTAPPALALSSNAAVRSAAAQGAGPAVLSRLAVADQLRSGELLTVPTAGLDLSRTLRAVWSGPRRLGGAAAQLVAVASGSTMNAR